VLREAPLPFSRMQIEWDAKAQAASLGERTWDGVLKFKHRLLPLFSCARGYLGFLCKVVLHFSTEIQY
jgi:hypothetical protein